MKLIQTKKVSLVTNNIFLFFCIAVLLRLYVYKFTYIINLDGVNYIHQAKVLFSGQLENLYNCGLQFLSIYPLFIAGLYKLCNDWIFAAKAVSFLFGLGVLIPLYFLLKRFFGTQTSNLTFLLFALCPVFVIRSIDVVRGPIFWFFLVWGLFFFIQYIENKKYCSLIFSMLFYLLSAWARTEGIILIPISIFYIFINSQNKLKVSIILGFACIISFLLVLILQAAFDISLAKYLRFHDILDKATEPFSKYNEVRSFLKNQALLNNSFFENFLMKARLNIWLIALGTIINNMLEAFFVPFCIFLIYGFTGIKEKIILDKRLFYFLLIFISGIIVLVFQLLQCWAMEHRYFAIVILSCAVFMGFGLENIIHYLQLRFRFKETTAIIIVCIFVLGTGFAKNLKPREKNKFIYKQMGEFIAKHEDPETLIQIVAGSPAVHKWVLFYANVNKKNYLCPDNLKHFSDRIFDSYDGFMTSLKNNNVKYIVWDERNWNIKNFNMEDLKVNDFKFLMDGYHPDTGQLKLYKIIFY